MNKYGEILEDGSLKFERLLPGPIERVWSWIADGDKRAEWLSGGGDSTQAGVSIPFDFQHDNLTPHAETIPEKYKDMQAGVSYEVKVTRCDPPHRLIWFWPNPGSDDVEVDITLSEKGEQVHLLLIQRGNVGAEHLTGSSAGWHVHLGIMEDKLNSRVPGPFWSAHEEKVAEYETRFTAHLKKLA